MDVYIHNTGNLPLKFKNERLYISKTIEDTRYKLYKTVIKGLTYKIQVKTDNFLLLNDLLFKYNDSSIEKDLLSNKYYYTIGLYKEYISASELYKKLINKGFTEIKIIPYIDGERKNKKEALKHAKEYLDLVNYLEREGSN